MKVYYCPKCEKRVAVPKENKGGICPQCNNPMILDNPITQRRRVSPVFLIALAITIFLAGGLWIYFDVVEFEDSQAEEIVLDFDDPQRASDVTPRFFSLWQFHSDDSVRRVLVLNDDAAEDAKVRVWAPSLRDDDHVVTLEIIGGELIDQSTFKEEYRGNMYNETLYTLLADDEEYGYDMLIDHPPHLHTGRPDRLISIGCDPQPYYAQNIVAVALPVESTITSINDHQPYLSITLEEWHVLFYDVSNISGHVSIHVTYEPKGNPPSLDWTDVEEAR